MRLAGIVILIVAALSAAAAPPAAARHRVLLDVNTPEESWDGVLNNVENLQKAFEGEPLEIEVVVHGKALGLLLKDGQHAMRITALAARGVVFAACENTMRRQKVTRSDLHPEAVTVPSAVAEIVRKQEAGWSYVKAGA